MIKTNKIAKSILSALAALFVVLSINSYDAQAQEGPQNYCVPNATMVPVNPLIGYPADMWCFPIYYMQYNYRYFTVPILQVQVYDAKTGEIKIDRESRANINIGQYTGPWEGCYKYTGVKGDLEPGATYRLRLWANYDYYQYMTSQYCYATYYTTRLFIDWNLDGDFHDADEWLNSPASISSQKTKKIGSNTYDWWAYYPGCMYNYMQEWEFTVPEENATGVGRLRVMTSYYYPYTAPVNNFTLGYGYNACWNGYAYNYTYYGGYYGYCYGEMEDYLVEFVIPIKEIFPTDKAPDDILLAAEAYDGTTRNGNVFKRPMVRFGGPQAAGALFTYKIIGPLPSNNTIYEARYNGSSEIPIGNPGMLDANFAYYVQNAVGSAVSGNYAFKTANGGEYQVVVGFKKPGAADYKIIKKNFTVSWEWDIAARTISMPLGNKEPRYYKYPRNLSMDLRGEAQNTGLRGIAKFDAYYRIYNSKGEMISERVINWDTANFGQYVVAAKQVVQLDFGTFKTDIPDEYKAILTVDLKSATDLEPYNDQFRRMNEAPYTFEVRDEIQAQANAILYPLPSTDIIAGRPFIPSVEIRNQGVGDITNCPTTITVTEEPSGKVVFTQTILVQDIPSGRYNLKTVYFDPNVITQPGNYKITFKVNHPDDLVFEDNEISEYFSVSGGLSGNYTIGTKYSGNSRNFNTIEEATDALFLRGLNASVSFEFTDKEYNVDSKNNFAPAWDLSTAIMGLGYNAQTGTYNTLTFKPSIDNSVTKGSIKINLNSTNGIGIFLGQSIGSTNSYSVQADNFGRESFIDYSNNGGYITFDGGANSSFKFVINSQRPAFAAAFYLNGGASNMTIKNVIVENGTPATACSVNLPSVVFSVVDGFTFTEDEYITETGYQGYSAGIVNRAKILALSNQDVVVALDTLPNKNNKFINNEVSGFGYGIISYGIGPLRVPELQDYRPFYNQNTEIANNKIYNVTGAGIVLGHEHGSTVNNNTIFDVNGNCGDFAAGIIAGGNSRLGVQGYNNMDLKINANKISNVRGNGAVYGILVDQNLNKYPVGNKFTNFPDKNDNLAVTNNAIFDIKAKTSNTIRVGIHALTERDKEVANDLSRLLSPRYTDVFIKDLLIANNTVLLSEDGVNNNNQFVGIGIQQAHSAKLMNNAVSITDGTISSNNEAASGIFYQGAYSYEEGGLNADRNAYWLQNANVAAYRHVYVDYKNKIVELGTRNEYLNLEQWQMASRSELNSVVSGDFSNDYYTMGTYPAELHVKSTVKGSVLSKRGDRMEEYTQDVNGVIRGQAGSRYDIGAVEFNGSLYNRDAEMLVITEPGSYRATTGLFSDAEYLMTDSPIPVTAIVRNSGNLQVTDKKFTANIYRQGYLGNWVLENTAEATADIEATEHAVINFNLADGIGKDFVPNTYNDLRSEYSTIPSQFLGMEANVTPLYKIEITVASDEFNSNNKVEKLVRFYLRRSEVKVLVSNQNYVDTAVAVTADDFASGLNKLAIDKGMNLIGWEIDLENGRYDYDVFHRSGWEPRNVDYTIYRSLFWSDGDDAPLTRLQKLNLTNFVNEGNVSEKKNLVIMSQEMVRENTNVDDADEVFVRDILRAEYRFPGNPLGNGQSYDGKTITGVNLARDRKFDIMSTGVSGDAAPMPGLMNIVEVGDGISKMAIRYDYAQNNEWPDAARIGGVGTTTLNNNVLYVAIDWRHFGDIETLLRGTFDFAEGNGGIVVPVELMNFEAQAIGKRVELNWRTASEQGSSRFEVERAEVNANGVSSFVKIDEVAAAGNSSIISNYGPIVDNNVNYGNTYSYRLKMVDADGKFDYSDVKTVTLGGLDGKAWLGTVKPNPVNANSVLEYGLGEGMNIEINLYDANGKVVRNLTNGFQTAGTYTISLNGSNLSSGTYTIVMNVGETVLTQSITVVK